MADQFKDTKVDKKKEPEKNDSSDSVDSKKEDAKKEDTKKTESKSAGQSASIKKDESQKEDSKPKSLDEAASALAVALKKSNESKFSSEKIAVIAGNSVSSSKKAEVTAVDKSVSKESTKNTDDKSSGKPDAAKVEDKSSDKTEASKIEEKDASAEKSPDSDKDSGSVSSEQADSSSESEEEKPKRRMPAKLKHFLLGFVAALVFVATFFGALWFVRLPSVSDTAALEMVELPEKVSFLENTKTMILTKLTPDETLEFARNYSANIQASSVMQISDDKDWEAAMIDELQDAFPNTEIQGTITAKGWAPAFLNEFENRYSSLQVVGTLKIGGVTVPLDVVNLDMRNMDTSCMSDLEEALPNLTLLEKIDFGTDDKGYESLKDISPFAQAHPELKVRYRFTVWGKDVSLHAKKLDLNHITMDDQGKQVRDVLPYMHDLTFLDMDFCNVDNEHMAAIRDDFPDIKVVWRIWFGARYSVRTDVEKILASAPLNGGLLNPENAAALKYCTDLKYLDIGHNDTLQDISFISFMPKLEVLIIMWGHVTDISPIADCPKMEFLEIFTNNITDLTPLKDLKEIKHLNICNNPNMDDITPLYGLHTLERLWIGRANRIPPEQVEKFMELNPDCAVKFTPCDPHEGWRWGVPRYEVLRETFGYGRADYQTIGNDPLYYPHPNDDEEEDDDY